jgi:hypothetical protein
MTTTASTATSPFGAHLVGSVPLANADAVIATAAAQLGDHLRRIPDGETGARTIWIVWQEQVFADNPDLEPVASDDKQYAKHTRYRVRAGATAASVEFGSLGYADHAIESYKRFAALKSRGQIRPDVRFQISLPTPLAPINQFAALDERAALEPRYEAAMEREIARIAGEIPSGEASIQIDIAFEMGMVEGIEHPLFEAWFPDALTGAADRIARISAQVPADVELGYHLCYGDFGHEHFLQPADAGRLVQMANAIAARVNRQIAFVHLPVPRERDDAAYMAPLANLRLHPETEVYLGLIHLTDGIAGAQRRIAAAQQALPRFGVAAECGFGRRPPETVIPLMQLHAAVAQPTRPQGEAERAVLI